MKTRVVLFLSLILVGQLLFSLAVRAASESGAKALFFGDTASNTVAVKHTSTGAAAFGGTEIKKETFDARANTSKPAGETHMAKATHHSGKKKIAKLATGLSYWVEVIKPSGKVVKTTAESRTFKSGERIRFAFKTNKDGYLYLLSVGSSGKGIVLFPDPRINGGQNFVTGNSDYRIPFGGKSFVMDANPGDERVYVFFSQSEIADIRDYFMGNDHNRNKQIEAQDTQKIYAYAESTGSKDIVFEEDAAGAGVHPASYVVNNSSNPDGIIFREITIRHQ
jgi:hypothetical protein